MSGNLTNRTVCKFLVPCSFCPCLVFVRIQKTKHGQKEHGYYSVDLGRRFARSSLVTDGTKSLDPPFDLVQAIQIGIGRHVV